MRGVAVIRLAKLQADDIWDMPDDEKSRRLRDASWQVKMSLNFFYHHCSISKGLPEKRENEFYFTHSYFEKKRLVPQRVLPHHAGTSAKIQLQAILCPCRTCLHGK